MTEMLVADKHLIRPDMQLRVSVDIITVIRIDHDTVVLMRDPEAGMPQPLNCHNKPSCGDMPVVIRLSFFSLRLPS